MRFNNHLLNMATKQNSTNWQPQVCRPIMFSAKPTCSGRCSRKCSILPGIDIGIPVGKNSRKASPDDTYAATLAAFNAGAQGVILSRKYSEMPLANLDAAGRQ